jgi:hypothetical protein
VNSNELRRDGKSGLARISGLKSTKVPFSGTRFFAKVSDSEIDFFDLGGNFGTTGTFQNG